MQVFLKVREGSSDRDIAVVDPDRLFTVGRGEHNDVVFAGDPQMSSRHLSIQLSNDRCVVHDLNSTNGTTLNGKRVSSASVTHGDVLRCGTTELIFDFSDADRGLPPRPLPPPTSRPGTTEDTLLAMDLQELGLTAPAGTGSREGFLTSDGGTERSPKLPDQNVVAAPPEPVQPPPIESPPAASAPAEAPAAESPPGLVQRLPEPVRVASQSPAQPIHHAPIRQTPASEASGPRPAASPKTFGAHPDPHPDIAATRGFCAETAVEIVQRFRLQHVLPLTPQHGEPPEDYLPRLEPLQYGIPVLKFMSYALPKRCGVWWLLQCVHSINELQDGELELLQMVESWIRNPSDANRRAAMDAAGDADVGRPASWTAMAAYHSVGSTTPSSAPEVPVKDHVAGQSIFAGITLATVQGSPSAVAARRVAFAALGLKVAAGELPWDGTPVAQRF